MDIIPLDTSNISLFTAYCQQHIAEHDDSFAADLTLLPSEDYPARILIHHKEVIGAVCLVRTEPFRQARKGRFLIFHTTGSGIEFYNVLLQSILRETRNLDFIYGFLPQTKLATGHLWEQLGFYIERRSYVLRFDGIGTPASTLPSGYTCRPLEARDDSAISSFCDLCNINFAHLAGHVASTADTIRKLLNDPVYLPGGIILLYEGICPIGTLGLSIESTEPDTTFIEMLSLHPDYRGRGLGRALLREGIRLSRENGYSATELSVNAENDAAVRLYLSEGFQQKQVMLCYRLNVPVHI